MEQSGIPQTYSLRQFPFREGVPRDSVKEEFHFVLPKAHMLDHVRTFADFAHTHISYAHMTVLTFVAEACTNVVKYRGDRRPDQLMTDLDGNSAARITPILTYVPKRTHTEGGDALTPEQLLADDNIAAYVISVLVRDEQLNLAYAFADQIDINRYGPPTYRKKSEDDDGIVIQTGGPPAQAVPAVAPAQANAQQYVGVNAFNDDESLDSEDGMEMDVDMHDPAEPAAAPLPVDGNRNNIDANKYLPLDTWGSRFWYPRKSGQAESKYMLAKRTDDKPKLTTKQRPVLHLKINSTLQFMKFFVSYMKGLSFDEQPYEGTSSEISVATVREDSESHFKNCFSLDEAVSQLERLGAAPQFCNLANWSSVDGHFVIPEQLELHVAARLRADLFNAESLFAYCMPHCTIIDKTIIQPTPKSSGSLIRLNNGTTLDLGNEFASIDFTLEHDRLRKLAEANEFLDVWQVYFDRFRNVEMSLRKEVQAAGYSPLPPDLLRRLLSFRDQGFRHFSAVNHVQNTNLPDGNKALLQWRIDYPEIRVPIMHLFEPTSASPMSPFSQWRANELMFAESVLKVADFMVPIFPKILRASMMVWLPFMNGCTNREHMQFVGPPGTMKSDTLTRFQGVFIDGTYIAKSGGSKKGILGPHRSQRLVEIYHELNSILAPSSDPRGSDQETVEIKLTQLSEGLYIYETSMEDPATNERIDVRKVSHYTNNVIGAKNPQSSRNQLSRDGAAAAMLDRTTREKVVPTASPGRQTMSERVFQDFMNAERSSSMPQEMFRVMQMAVADYCCLMSCYAVPLPNIDLFASVAPNAFGYLSTMHPQLANRLRDISRVKSRLYTEIITDMARQGVCSAIGLAKSALTGDAYIYNTEEAVREMSKYAYTTYEQMVFVLSGSVYNMSEGQYNSIMATFIVETTDYIPMGYDPSDDAPQAWPAQPVDLDAPAQPGEAQGMLARAKDLKYWTLEQVLDELLKYGKNYLGTPRTNKSTGEHADQPYIMREHGNKAVPLKESHRATYEYSNSDNPKIKDSHRNLDLDLFSVVAGVTNDNPEPPRLERSYNCEQLFKVEQIGAQQYINFNYIRINGTPDEYANSFSDPIGGKVMTPDTIKDIIYTLRNTKVIVPYIPLVPKDHDLAKLHPGYVQSLRYSYSSLRKFKLFNVPVVITDSKRFYILAAYSETDPALVIEKMVEHMCYESTRETRTMIGVPSADISPTYRTVHIKPRPGVALTVARKTNLTKSQFERLQKQFDMSEADIDGYSQEGSSVYTTVDIEEQMALRAIFYAHPEMSLEQAKLYTPRGIWKRFYGEQGVYREGNPYTVSVEPEAEAKKRKSDEAPRDSKRRKQPSLVVKKTPIHVGLDMQPPQQHHHHSTLEVWDD